MPQFPFAENPNSDLRQVALALLEADDDSVRRDPMSQTKRLRNGLLNMHNPELLLGIVTTMVSCISIENNATPRSVYESLFSMCPTDAEWREMEAAWRESLPEEESG